MKSLAWLTEQMLHDCGIRCGVDPSRDRQTVRERSEAEGDAFLTITLPVFCQAFERALSRGQLQRSDTPAFSWHRKGLPEFLRGFLLQVFDRTGLLLDVPSVEAIACVRQICRMHAKIKRQCSNRRIKAAIDGYVKVEKDLGTSCLGAHLNERFRRVAAIVWTDLFRDVAFGDLRDRLVPRHGPGAVRERLSANSRWTMPTWTARLEREFPASEFAIASPLAALDEPSSFPEILTPVQELPVRVTLVPKTQKTPRVIAIEPACNQFMQQALLRELVPLIESGRYTGGRVNFTDQTINQRLAVSASLDGQMATLDMSEASDRVSSKHVAAMLASVPVFRRQVFACRSLRAELPDGRVVPLRKFASMGSALCFPMEAMVFFCIIVAARIESAGRPVTPATVFKYSRQVYVYGDDLIVPADEAPSIMRALEGHALKVNSHKSFWTGQFRESCGQEAYAGERVTPVYLREDLPGDRREASKVISLVSAANQFYLAGYWHMARVLRKLATRAVGRIPHLRDDSPGLGWRSYSNTSTHSRWNSHLMRFEQRAWVVTPVRTADPVKTGWAALAKCFRLMGSNEPTNREHLTSSVWRGRHTLKARWVSA